MKSVVVTGSSTGIGWGAARVLVDNGFRVFGGVRKPDDGVRLVKEFGKSFTPLIFDVTAGRGATDGFFGERAPAPQGAAARVGGP